MYRIALAAISGGTLPFIDQWEIDLEMWLMPEEKILKLYYKSSISLKYQERS